MNIASHENTQFKAAHSYHKKGFIGSLIPNMGDFI